MTPTETAAILRQFNAWRRDFDDKIHQPDPREIGEAIDAAVEMIDRLELAESSVAWHRRRWMALQMHQTKMREPERTMICDILANGELMHPTVAGDRYALPGAQPAPSLASGDVSLISEGKTRPAPSVPVAALRPVIDWLRNGCDPQEAAKELEMLAAAPEARP